MKNNRLILFLSFLSSSLFFAGSCSTDYLDTDPSTSVSESLVGSSIDNLYLALNGIHRKMVSQDKAVQYMGGYPGFMICLDASSDDLTWALDRQFAPVHQWQIQSAADHSFIRVVWESYYEFIANANIILQHVDKFAETDPALFRQVKGEALCFRAFSHFMLVQLYAGRFEPGQSNEHPGIPYRTDALISEMPRTPVSECYRLIEADLDQAIGLLEGCTPKSISHFSPIVARGLKARVSLTCGNYAEAASQALLAIDEAERTGFALMEGEQLYHGFADIATDCKEALWAALTLDDQTVNYYSFYALMSWNFNSEPVRTGTRQISQDLYDALPETDLRRQWWDPSGELPLPSDAYAAYPYSNRKFTARAPGNPVGQVAFMRLSELYLIAAEASLRAGDEIQAASVFAGFMMTRDSGYQPSATASGMLDQILFNRRIELWGEGFRYYDLKRSGLPLSRTGSNFDPGFCVVLEVPASDPRWQWAIPQAEMDANKQMVQNPY